MRWFQGRWGRESCGRGELRSWEVAVSKSDRNNPNLCLPPVNVSNKPFTHNPLLKLYDSLQNYFLATVQKSVSILVSTAPSSVSRSIYPSCLHTNVYHSNRSTSSIYTSPSNYSSPLPPIISPPRWDLFYQCPSQTPVSVGKTASCI